MPHRLYIYWLVTFSLFGAVYGAAQQRLDLSEPWSLVFAAFLGFVALGAYVLLSPRGYFRYCCFQGERQSLAQVSPQKSKAPDEARMHVMVVHHTPSLTQERYEAVVRGLTGGKPRLESPADVPTPGLLVHAAAETDDGFMIFDVFESEEAFDKFRAIASPIATEAGVEEPPKSYPLHTYISV